MTSLTAGLIFTEDQAGSIELVGIVDADFCPVGEDEDGLVGDALNIELEVKVEPHVFGTADNGANRELESVETSR